MAAVDQAGNLAPFSSRGARLTWERRGSPIYSTYLHNSYALLTGTSQAARFVAGVVALILSWARANGITINGVEDVLQRLDDLTDEHGRIGPCGLGVPRYCNRIGE